MATKKTTPGQATEPVDYSQIPQDGGAEKPTAEQLAKAGYVLPDHFAALEEAAGDPAEAGRIIAEQSDAPLTLDQVNARADAIQAEAMGRQGRTYTVLGQGEIKPSASTSAAAESEGEATATRARARSGRSR